MATAHTLGIRGHFSIASLLQKAADHYSVRVMHNGKGSYSITPADNAPENSERAVDIASFTPSFIEHDDNIYGRNETKALLDFMNQPFRVLSERRQEELNPGLDKKEKIDAGHADRVAFHRLMRFATNGTVEIPIETEEELEKETAECHAKTEQAMRDRDLWRNQLEIGNKKTISSAIPNSSIDPKGGFKFDLSPQSVTGNAHQGQNQEKLNALFWDAINAASGNRYETPSSTVCLTASELETFYNHAHDMGLGELIDKVEFEEAVQEKMDNVRERATKLEMSAAFTGLTKNSAENSAHALRDLMTSSTAMRPVVTSDEMQNVWKRYHYTDRNDSPLSGIGKEYATFAALMDIYAAKEDVTPAELEAIKHEFAPLLAFSDRAAEILKEGFDKADVASPAKQVLDKVTENFQATGLTDVSISQDMLKDDYQDVLSALEKYIEQGGSALSQTKEAAVDTALDFTMDVVNFIKESPTVAATFVGLATTLFIMNGGSSDDAQAAAETIMVFGENGLEEITINNDLLPEEAQDSQNWHWDMGPFGMYKHYMYDNAVVGPAQTMMDWMRIAMQTGLESVDLPVNTDPAFSKAAETTADKLGAQLFNINLFQNASHAAFWMYMASKGYNHGTKGAHKIFDLMSPLTDLSYQAGVSTGEALRIKQKTSLADRLHGLTKDVKLKTSPEQAYQAAWEENCPFANAACALASYNECLGKNYRETVTTLAEAAEVRIDVEEALQKDLTETDISVMLAKSKKTIHIDRHTLDDNLKALAQFDVTLEHMASHVGIGEPWYQHYVRERIHDVTDALLEYEHTGDRAELEEVLNENLEELVQIQIRHTGTSPLYASFIGDDMPEKENDFLESKAGAQYGKMKRAETIRSYKAEIADKENPLALSEHITKRAGMMGTMLWDSIVGVSRNIKNGVGKVAGNKYAVVGASAIAATSVMLDMASGGNNITDAISSGVGGTISSVVTTSTFAVYNFWEDVLGVHVLSGLMLLGAGAGAGYVSKRIANPTASASFEGLRNTTGLDVSARFEKMKERFKAKADKFADSIKALNDRAGAYISGADYQQNTDGDDSRSEEEDYSDVYFIQDHQDKHHDDNHPT